MGRTIPSFRIALSIAVVMPFPINVFSQPELCYRMLYEIVKG
jgi:hypothetical protein